MFGRALDGASSREPVPDDAGAKRQRGPGYDRRHEDRPEIRRSRTSLSLADRLEAFRTGRARTVLDAQRAEVQELAERAAELDKAAERFRRAGDEKTAASFAEQAAELRRAGA
jgi:hypothetical protein